MDTVANAIEVVNVEKRFAGTLALHGVSFSVPANAIFSIVGPSGSGKTTLLKMIAEVTKADGGAIKLQADGNTMPIQDVVMVWQSLALFPHLNVAENIEFGLKVQRKTKEERSVVVKNLLQSVGLAGFEKRRINGLSGGEQQRVALARAIAVKPRVLLLDEPLEGMDQHLRREIINLIRKIHQEENLTIVMVTHNQTEALSLSSHIAVINKGRIEQHGTLSAVLEQPKTGFVARFLGKRNVLEGQVKAVEGCRVLVAFGDVEYWGAIADWCNGKQLKTGSEVYYIVDRRKVVVDDKRENSLRGEVAEFLFDGSLLSIRISRNPLGPFWADLIPDEKLIQPYDSITLSWNIGDAYVLPRQSS